MRARFAHLTKSDFGGGKRSAVVPFPTRVDARQRVLRIFDELQVAISNGNQELVDRLLVELARACKRTRHEGVSDASTRSSDS